MSLCASLKAGFLNLIAFMKNKETKFMVSQNDPRKTNWELFVIVLALYNCIFIPIDLTFEPD